MSQASASAFRLAFVQALAAEHGRRLPLAGLLRQDNALALRRYNPVVRAFAVVSRVPHHFLLLPHARAPS